MSDCDDVPVISKTINYHDRNHKTRTLLITAFSSNAKLKKTLVGGKRLFANQSEESPNKKLRSDSLSSQGEFKFIIIIVRLKYVYCIYLQMRMGIFYH